MTQPDTRRPSPNRQFKTWRRWRGEGEQVGSGRGVDALPGHHEQATVLAQLDGRRWRL